MLSYGVFSTPATVTPARVLFGQFDDFKKLFCNRKPVLSAEISLSAEPQVVQSKNRLPAFKNQTAGSASLGQKPFSALKNEFQPRKSFKCMKIGKYRIHLSPYQLWWSKWNSKFFKTKIQASWQKLWSNFWGEMSLRFNPAHARAWTCVRNLDWPEQSESTEWLHADFLRSWISSLFWQRRMIMDRNIFDLLHPENISFHYFCIWTAFFPLQIK